MISELLASRALPDPLRNADGTRVTAAGWEARRQEILRVLSENVFGRMPDFPGGTAWRQTEVLCAEKALLLETRFEITFPAPDGTPFTFPVTVSRPGCADASAPKPAFVFISFGRRCYFPLEELMEQGVVIAEMVMDDVAADREDRFGTLLAARCFPGGQRAPDAFGKIGMWAYAASRVLDLLLAQPYVDPAHVGVIGHSRLGKTALWAGACDTRFTHVFSNDSGCMGAALTRKKAGETCPDIYRVFPYWFCENLRAFSGSPEEIERASFDQHFLLAACAPRKVYVASASQDEWADPVSEYLSCAAASPVWELLGLPGFLHPDRLPEEGDRFAEGNIGYHLRAGEHFLSRYDWVRYADFLKK